MSETRPPQNGFTEHVDALEFLHSIVLDPGCLEAGLRFLEMERSGSADACLAWGFDRNDDPVALYISSDLVRRHELESALSRSEQWLGGLAPSISAPAETGARNRRGGRILVLARRFADDLVTDRSLGGIATELLRWTRTASAPGDILVEALDVSEGPPANGEEFAFGAEEARVHLTPREIESLLAADSPTPSGGRA